MCALVVDLVSEKSEGESGGCDGLGTCVEPWVISRNKFVLKTLFGEDHELRCSLVGFVLSRAR
jgi:hypothetical protein